MSSRYGTPCRNPWKKVQSVQQKPENASIDESFFRLMHFPLRNIDAEINQLLKQIDENA